MKSIDLDKKVFSARVDGKELTLQVSKMAEQANAAVLGTFGDTSVLVTAVMGKKDKDADYFPLSVDYEERFYAVGKILGSRFMRREGRPSQDAILSGRLIDRTLRPLFDSRVRRDVQIIATVLSYDGQNDPDFVSLVSASTALLISDIPWGGPVAGLKIARTKDGKTLINPTVLELEENEISFQAFLSGTKDKINMIELAGSEAKEDDILDAFKKGQEEIKKICDFQSEISEKIGKAKLKVALKETDLELKNKVLGFLNGKLESAVYGNEKSGLSELKEELYAHLEKEGVSDVSGVERILEEEIDAMVHKNILEFDKRPDGRALDEVRPLLGEVGILKRLHGSALFVRGGTQSLAITTLGAPGAEQLVETMESSTKRRFMLHYNFPPYSVGETGRVGAPGRREIGHGALAEKAITPMLPKIEDFPYAIRVVSEILASNGSSSMATTCATSMALMDAGVPIKKQVAGIAMGLIEGDSQYKILTDIQGPEDHYGDMDCKVAGTDEGVNAIQMDIKINGVTLEILKDAFAAAKKARMEILGVMNAAIGEPRKELSPFAPMIITLNINPERIGELIGPGGKMINGIIADTGVLSIDVEEDGKVFVSADNKKSAEDAVAFIKSLMREFEIGEIVEGKIIKILEFGAIMDLGGDKDGMIHVSELKEGFVKKVEDVVKFGDTVRAKIIKFDNGKIGLSMKGVPQK
jgi:polyribonucleotide nucleotidyltransferase